MSTSSKNQLYFPLLLFVLLLSTSSSSIAYYLFIVPLLAFATVISVLGVSLWLTWRNEKGFSTNGESGGTSGRRGKREGGGGGGGSLRRRIPPLYFTSPAAWSMTQTKASWESSSTLNRPSLFPDAPDFLASAIQDLLSLISRDFIVRWYSSMSDSPIFPNAVEHTISETLVSVATRVGEVDWSDVLVGRILPLLTSHLDTFRAAEQALRRQDLLPPESDELDIFLASRYSAELKSGKLHQAVDVASPNSRPTEEAWLRDLIGRILPLILPEREIESAAVAIMVREIVACAVMLPVFDMLGDPDFWNRIIDDKAGNAIRDQKMVNQFREALDKQAPSGTSLNVHRTDPSSSTTLKRMETISVKTGPKQFDSWLRSIGKTKNLADAKRLRSDVTAQVRKARGIIEGKSSEEAVDSVKVLQWIEYIERLQTAKRRIDQKIEELGGQNGETRRTQAATIYDPKLTTVFRLRDILRDPTSLSYFMEFEERRKSSERVQFWLLVEGLKDPLEDQVDEVALGSTASVPLLSNDAIDDLRLIWESYLCRDPFQSSPTHLRTIQAFVGRPPTDSFSVQELRKVRFAIFAIQNEVLVTLEDDEFPSFVASDLYFKAIANLQLPSTAVLPKPGQSEEAGPGKPSFAGPPRRRSLSNPLRPSRQVSIPLAAESRQARNPSPVPPIQLAAGKNLGAQRIETLPPQVTFKDPFDSPKVRKNGSDGGYDLHTSRKTSSGSLDTQHSTSSGAMSSSRKGTGGAGVTGLSDSLEFLMASPTPETQERSPLFDEVLPDRTEEPEEVVDHSPNSEDDYIRVETIEAIQDALNSILETNARTPTLNQRQLSSNSPELERSRSKEGSRRTLPPPRHPSLSTFPSSSPSTSHPSPISPSAAFSTPVLPPPTRTASSSSAPISTRKHKAVFEDAESFDDLDLDRREPDFDPQSIQLAAPGDLNLPVEIKRLGASLEKLKNQESVVGALIRKAELTGNASELKILVKSQDSLRREIRAATFQKDQYENQEAENKLTPSGTRVTIPGTTVGQADGQSFQLYLVEVHQVNGDGSFRSGWIVTRRYSEFASLYSKMKDKFVPARYLDFPPKRIVTSYSKEFIEQRRIGLERYLQALIKIPIVCRSEELRAFLSQQTISLPKSDPSPRIPAGLNINHGFMRTFYRSVTSGIDDVLGTSTTSMMDTIVERLSQQAASGVIQAEDLVEQTMNDALNTVGSSRIGEEGLTYFTAPICDLFVTVFELREKNNWLRRQAILIVLQQVLGGTIERKFRDSVKMLLAPTQLVSYISSLESGLWPDGQLKPKTPPRTAEEKLATKESANRKLSALMPDVAANLIGRHNARQGARTLFAILQNKRLLKHLIFSIVDEVVAVIFPEIATPSTPFSNSRPLFVS